MKKRLFSLILVCAMALTLTACTKKPEEKPENKPPVTPPPADEIPEKPATPDTMAELYGYMGRADKDVVGAYGEGKKIMGDKDVLAGREYRMTLFGMETPVIVNYDAAGNVDTIHLAPTDFKKETWSKTLTDAYGKPTGDEKTPQWVKNGMVFSFGENDRVYVTREKK